MLKEQLVFAGSGNNRYVSGIVLTFSSALDPKTAANSSNYTVTQAMTAGRARAVKPIRLHATYKPANHVVKLTFAGKPRFAAGGQLRLVATGPTESPADQACCLKVTRGTSRRERCLHDSAERPRNWRVN